MKRPNNQEIQAMFKTINKALISGQLVVKSIEYRAPSPEYLEHGPGYVKLEFYWR